MGKCISVEAAKGAIGRVCFCRCLDEETEKDLINAVDGLLPEDVKKNVYGKWIKKEIWRPLPNDIFPIGCGDDYDEVTHSEKDTIWICDMCGEEKDGPKPTDNFCSRCGADMRERKKDKDNEDNK